MSALTQQYQGKVRVLHINIDDPAALPYVDKYRIRGTPSIVLFDRHGRVAANVPGWPGTQQVDQALRGLVQQP